MRTERSIAVRLSETPNKVASLFTNWGCSSLLYNTSSSSATLPIVSCQSGLFFSSHSHKEPFRFSIKASNVCNCSSIALRSLRTVSIFAWNSHFNFSTFHSHSCLNCFISPCCWRILSSSSLSFLRSSLIPSSQSDISFWWGCSYFTFWSFRLHCACSSRNCRIRLSTVCTFSSCVTLTFSSSTRSCCINSSCLSAISAFRAFIRACWLFSKVRKSASSFSNSNRYLLNTSS